MKLLWCWRCKMDVPMLDDDEFRKAKDLYSADFKKIKEDRFKPLLRYYYELTGFAETNPVAILHHKITLYGPPCKKCGKPYRTPVASFCAACGNIRPDENS
ncbi:hypothetical protein [Mucilaginibacter segetis]|uniref:Uncharacterized protein n=1 Tax=Mucilaginibacter segetis TaxID=2793071 RepID=A0A934PQH6_9SPHI|nr:hypothetical protein [Mucilaginibacter segetis]MBK0378889.1 hypothetical protein [Mucilaginibacter segetis]